MSTAAPMFDENDFDAFLEGAPVAKPVCTRKPVATISSRRVTALALRVRDAVLAVSPGGWSWDITTTGGKAGDPASFGAIVDVHGTDENGIGAGSFGVEMEGDQIVVSFAVGEPRKTFAKFVWDGANTPKYRDPTKGDRLTHPVRAEMAAVVVALRGVLS